MKTTQKPCANENYITWKIYKKKEKKPCTLESQITKTDSKSQNLRLYPKSKIFKTMFTLELIPR
jgi:hypothetical protein